MKWSWRVGEFLGIRVYVHATFLLLIGWIALTHFMQGQTLQSALAGIVFTMAIFLSVLLHEYGHALAARRFRNIFLSEAELDRGPEDSGPACSLFRLSPVAPESNLPGLTMLPSCTKEHVPNQADEVAQGFSTCLLALD
jgi:hypothetical protein